MQDSDYKNIVIDIITEDIYIETHVEISVIITEVIGGENTDTVCEHIAKNFYACIKTYVKKMLDEI